MLPLRVSPDGTRYAGDYLPLQQKHRCGQSDEVRKRTRQQLMQGASQIKLTAGGGVASPFSPLEVTTFTEFELRAAVEAATD
jgi:imidazolonepropionase-like amidohydrolase